MKKKILCILGYYVIFLLFVACTSNKTKYDAEGNFESTEVIVSAESTGRIMSFDLSEGQHVNAGEKIGVIDSVQLYLSKLQLEKNASSIHNNRPDVQKQIAAIEEQLRKQKVEFLRLEKLFNDGAATQKQLDDVNSQIAVLEKQLDAQKSTLQNSVSSINDQSLSVDMQIAQINNKLSKCTIYSPVSGIVLSKYVEEGEFATIGKHLFKVANLDKVFLRAYITSSQLSKIKLGQKVQVYADFGGNNVYKYDGVVEWISQKSEFTPKNIQTDDERENLVYAVKISVNNDGNIKLGMYGGIKIN